MNRNIILTETEFKNIYRGYLKYLALQSGGVDNWEWYSESLSDFLRDCYLENHPDRTIDDSVSINEVYDKYKIIDIEGKIYTIMERED